ncbi:DUF805 domain-containing protein [Rosenbergiella australiborealis]
MLENFMQRLLAVLRCYKRTFSYQGVENRRVYTLFLLLQSSWFALYLNTLTSTLNEISLLPLLFFLLPLISIASRRINDAGYSHWIILLVFFIPYLFFIFLCFPKTVDK